jgi:hypothetical protein
MSKATKTEISQSKQENTNNQNSSDFYIESSIFDYITAMNYNYKDEEVKKNLSLGPYLDFADSYENEETTNI